MKRKVSKRRRAESFTCLFGRIFQEIRISFDFSVGWRFEEL